MALLDQTDCEILRIVQKNARVANKTLAEKVGLAESTCLMRVRRLREEGVIRGTRTVVDAQALGIGVQAMVAVQLRSHSRTTVEQFQEAAANRPEVVACYHLGGRTDFLLHVTVRDPAHLRDLILSAFTARDEVQHVETSLIYDQQHTDAWPIYPEARKD